MLSRELALEEAMDLSQDRLRAYDGDDTSTQYMKVILLFTVSIDFDSWALP
jgi:hypothetical protein